MIESQENIPNFLRFRTLRMAPEIPFMKLHESDVILGPFCEGAGSPQELLCLRNGEPDAQSPLFYRVRISSGEVTPIPTPLYTHQVSTNNNIPLYQQITDSNVMYKNFVFDISTGKQIKLMPAYCYANSRQTPLTETLFIEASDGGVQYLLMSAEFKSKGLSELNYHYSSDCAFYWYALLPYFAVCLYWVSENKKHKLKTSFYVYDTRARGRKCIWSHPTPMEVVFGTEYAVCVLCLERAHSQSSLISTVYSFVRNAAVEISHPACFSAILSQTVYQHFLFVLLESSQEAACCLTIHDISAEGKGRFVSRLSLPETFKPSKTLKISYDGKSLLIYDRYPCNLRSMNVFSFV